MTTLTIDMPDDLAEEAKDAGLLAPDAVEAMLRETLRQCSVNGLFEATDTFAAADFPPMTLAEIQEGVNAVRCQGRRRASGS